MRRILAVLAALSLLFVLQVPAAHAVDPSPSPCPSPSPSPSPTPSPVASDARTSTSTTTPSPTPATCPPPVDPNQVLYDALKARLGSDLARALTTQERLSAALDQTAVNEQVLSDQISAEEDRISSLEDQIAQLDGQISDTQNSIDVEKAQVAGMARAIYRQPNSFWLLVARTGNLRDALLATADLVIAGQRAHALQAQLQADLAKLQTDRSARLADLDRENATRDQLVNSLNAMDDLLSRQDDLFNQLDDLISQIQDAASALLDQPPSVTADLAQVLEQALSDVVQKSYQAAWLQAQVGAGLAMVVLQLPPGKGPNGLRLAWPMPGAHITQPFGPSDLLLEPPLGPYAHFHTGIDLAAPLGAPVLAAADGVVVAVAHTRVGYGNYVIIAHGGGVMTLYGHLLETQANVGDKVVRGQRIGREGSSGLSTGPHLHFELRVNDQVINPMTFLPPL